MNKRQGHTIDEKMEKQGTRVEWCFVDTSVITLDNGNLGYQTTRRK